LTAFYPTDGVPLLDHPFVVVGGTRWGNEKRAAVAGDFHAYLLGKKAQDYLARQGFRPLGGAAFAQDPSDVGVLREPPRQVFRPDPDSVPAESVTAAWKSARRTARVLFAVDVSGSMVVPGADGVRPLDAAKDAIGPALDLVSGDDEIGLWMFSMHLGAGGAQDHRELVGLGAAQDGAGARREQVRRALVGLRGERGDTGLFDTIDAGVAMLRADGADANNALVVFTDARNDDPGGIDAGGLALELSRRGAPPVKVTLLAFGDGNCGQDALTPLRSAGVTCLDVTNSTVGTALERVGSGLWGGD
jgi:Ca-activated chloride channel family protein